VTVAAFALSAVAAVVAPAQAVDEYGAARGATARYQDISRAVADGFGELQDVNHIACIDNPAGGMGIHYVLGSRVGNAAESAAEPEVLVYEPQANGRMRLVAVEYVVTKANWESDPTHVDPPSLFGTTFELVPEGNRYGLPDFYELHAWIWKHNPNGIHEDWNPNVTCDNA
jgi:hypothetical protein